MVKITLLAIFVVVVVVVATIACFWSVCLYVVKLVGCFYRLFLFFFLFGSLISLYSGCSSFFVSFSLFFFLLHCLPK